MSYFSYFPLIRYNDRVSLNLLRRVKIIDDVLARREIYYEYVVRDGDLPDTLADRFYGDPQRDWIIYFSNSIVDPYTEWPLGYADFNSFLEKKYNKSAFETKADIAYYVYTGLSSDSEEDIARRSWRMTEKTFNSLSAQERSGWTPVTVYDHEDQVNESRRVIKIIQPAFLNQILREIDELLT